MLQINTKAAGANKARLRGPANLSLVIILIDERLAKKCQPFCSMSWNSLVATRGLYLRLLRLRGSGV